VRDTKGYLSPAKEKKWERFEHVHPGKEGSDIRRKEGGGPSSPRREKKGRPWTPTRREETGGVVGKKLSRTVKKGGQALKKRRHARRIAEKFRKKKNPTTIFTGIKGERKAFYFSA